MELPILLISILNHLVTCLVRDSDLWAAAEWNDSENKRKCVQWLCDRQYRRQGNLGVEALGNSLSFSRGVSGFGVLDLCSWRGGGCHNAWWPAWQRCNHSTKKREREREKQKKTKQKRERERERKIEREREKPDGLILDWKGCWN